ncbi:saoe class I histocompatibility antigen, A alpha chain-like [Microtus ochrogaster]|uniref:Saoe class I histocompatibility antigen, A alpha chain-like n=1 Tax=Microtus ochrogaster TaxID=79684 RepID=A0ABM1TX44_MICOH|nr:saoe class I histocompatibility antigen, A alpha chain-like [Microtus ochrogaster]
MGIIAGLILLGVLVSGAVAVIVMRKSTDALAPTQSHAGEYQVERETTSAGRIKGSRPGPHPESHVSTFVQPDLPSPRDGQPRPSSRLQSVSGTQGPAPFPAGAPVPRSSWVQGQLGPLVGSHSLRYFTTSLYNPEFRKPRIIVVCYVDNTQILSFDSKAASQRVEPRVQFMAEDAEHLEELTRISRRILIAGQVDLWSLFGYHSQKGSHTIQWLSGCDVGPDHRLLRGYKHVAYEGQDYISLTEDLRSWIAVDTKEAQITRRKWEAAGTAMLWRSFLEGTCVEWLLKYLDEGKEVLQRAGTWG